MALEQSAEVCRNYAVVADSIGDMTVNVADEIGTNSGVRFDADSWLFVPGTPSGSTLIVTLVLRAQ